MSTLLRESVRTGYPAFSRRFEGRVPWMYLDRHEPDPLVTTGEGNLIDPANLAFGLGWVRPDGSLASADEVLAAWQTVKSRPDLAPLGGGNSAFASLTNVRLPPEAIDTLVAGKLDANAEIVTQDFFPQFATLPADAQTAIMSMAWAMGAEGFRRFPKLVAAVNQNDFATAAEESRMQGTGIAPRNEANRLSFLNAAEVVSNGFDPDVLYYPSSPLNPDVPTSPASPQAKGGGGGAGSGGTALLFLVGLGGALWWAFRRG